MNATDRFRALHSGGLLVMPNAWDVGSARLLEHAGFSALATTSSGFAASLGRPDQHVRRDELLRHVEAIVAATTVPLNVDAEGCYPGESGGIGRTVELIADAGAAGVSIEDHDPASGLLPIDVALDRLAEALTAARPRGLVVTARAENHLYGVDDLEDTLARLVAYHEAGADVVYAPGLTASSDIEKVVDSVDAPVNVLAMPGVPPTEELAGIGVRRVSTGGSLAWVAYRALVDAGRELLEHGTTSYLATQLAPNDRDAAFSPHIPNDHAG
jgi:2-methylisocitrate lyase-like PEP mutase family enzyme